MFDSNVFVISKVIRESIRAVYVKHILISFLFKLHSVRNRLDFEQLTCLLREGFFCWMKSPPRTFYLEKLRAG